MPSDRQQPAPATTRRVALRMAADGLPMDDVGHYGADEAHLRSYEQASEAMSRFKVPVLLDRADPHSHLIVALMDGTGNDVDQDPVHATNVARFKGEIDALTKSGIQRIHVEYTPGPGTQSNLLERTVDGALGRTSLERAEWTYEKLVKQSQSIFEADPSAKISLHLEGFSRGASQVPLLARMIEERGIPDLESASLQADADGQLRTVYSRYHQPPGRTLMSVGLYDPVPTGYMELMDRRLPPSVVSGFQISAAHERRGLFPSDQILPQGMSTDGRFLHVSVAGAHSDIGGSYLRGGLGVRSLNLMTDYHNSLFNEPLLQRLHEPQDARLNVVHHSEQGNLLFRVAPKVERDALAGQVHQLKADPSRHGPHGNVVHLPAQAPEPMRADLRHAIALRQPIGKTAALAVPLVNEGEALLQQLRNAQVDLRAYQPPALQRPGVRMAGALGTLGVASSVYEGVQTAAQVDRLLAQGNALSAQSTVAHYGARAAGGWLGGAAAGALVGWESGPAVIAFVSLGALSTSSAADKVVDWWDERTIYRQIDRQGQDWRFNGRAWVRSVDIDDRAGTHHTPAQVERAASLDKARELDYLATNAATQLALGRLPPPQDPYRLPPNGSDRPFEDAGTWQRVADTGQWKREVVSGRLEHGIALRQWETASPARAAELDQEAALRIEQNIANGPIALAARYEEAYQRLGWDDFGAMPAPILAAVSDADRLLAHDGKLYTRQADGQWQHDDDRPVQGNLLQELEGTRAVLQPALQQHGEQMAQIPARAAASPQQLQRDTVAYQYAIAGVELKPQWLDAVLLATQRTRQAHGLREDALLQLQPDPSGSFNADSPVAHFQRNGDTLGPIVAVTRSSDIHQALDELQALATRGTLPPGTAEQRTATPPQATVPTAAPPPRYAMDTNAPAPEQPRTLRETPAALEGRPVPGRQIPPSMQAPSHPGHGTYRRALDAVNRLEAATGIEAGPHSEQLAAAIAARVQEDGDRHHHLRLHLHLPGNGMVEITSRDHAGKAVGQTLQVDTDQAMQHSLEQHSTAWAQACSPHFASQAPAALRSPQQQALLDRLPPNERALFDHIREQLPVHLDDAYAMQAMVAARKCFIDSPQDIENIHLAGEKLTILGSNPFHGISSSALDRPPPTLLDSMAESRAWDAELGQLQQAASQRREQDQGMWMR